MTQHATYIRAAALACFSMSNGVRANPRKLMAICAEFRRGLTSAVRDTSNE
jgi:hypothetical protein